MKLTHRPAWPAWVRDLLSHIMSAAKARPGAPVSLEHYAVASLPAAASWSGALIYVPDESGGAVPAFSDGTNWRRVTDRAVVS